MPGGFRQIILSDSQLRAGLYAVDVREVPQEIVVALLPAEPRTLEEHAGIVFQDSHDDLDFVKVAVLELDSGRRVSLVRHVRSSAPDIEIYVPPEDADRPSVLIEVLDALGLSRSDLFWVRPTLE